jgi:hypothetical protein
MERKVLAVVPVLERNQSNSAQAKSIEGGFFLRKKPLGGIAPGYTYSDSALASSGSFTSFRMTAKTNNGKDNGNSKNNGKCGDPSLRSG